MMFGRFLRVIEKNAEGIRGNLLDEIRLRSGTWHYLGVSDEEISGRITQVLRNLIERLGTWLNRDTPETTLFASYSLIGAERCREGIPLEEVTLVVFLIKREVWNAIRNHIVVDDGFTLSQFLEFNFYASLFFDRIIQSIIAGYENEQALMAVENNRKNLAAGTPREKEGKGPGDTRDTPS